MRLWLRRRATCNPGSSTTTLDRCGWFATANERPVCSMAASTPAIWLGAAIENATIAAAYRGVRTEVCLLPDTEDASIAAKLTFEGSAPPDGELASWFAELGVRATNRRLAPRVPLRVYEAEVLRQAAV